MQNYMQYTVAWWGLRSLSVLAPVAFFTLPLGFPGTTDFLMQYGLYGFGGMIVVVVGIAYGGYKGASLVEAWHWKAVGREVGLTPSEEGLPRESLSHDDRAAVNKSILTGRIRGYSVRARFLKESASGRSNSTRTVTVVDADLDRPAEEGVIIESAESGFLGGSGLVEMVDSGSEEVDVFEEGPNVPGARFVALADPPELARAVLSGRSRDALAAVTSFNRVLVGNAEEVFRDALPDYEDKIPDVGGFSLGSAVGSGIKTMMQGSQIRGDAATVTHCTTDSVLDPEELERQVEAVIAVAEAFERARTGVRAE